MGSKKKKDKEVKEVKEATKAKKAKKIKPDTRKLHQAGKDPGEPQGKKGKKGRQESEPQPQEIMDRGLQATIQRTRQLIEGLSLPSRPNLLMRAVNTQNAFAPDLTAVAQVVREDAALASQVLAEANSALPGHERQVASIHRAVMLLGLERIREIVTEAFLSSALISKDGRLQELRHRSIQAAQAAAWVAQEIGGRASAFQSGYLPPVDPEAAFILGLFHDVGLTIMMQKFPDYQSFYDHHRTTPQGALVEAENMRYQTNHCIVGYLMAEQWHLPEYLCAVIRTHHDLEGFNHPGEHTRERLSPACHAVLSLAEFITGEVMSNEWPATEQVLCRFIGLQANALNQLKQDALEALPVSADG